MLLHWMWNSTKLSVDNPHSCLLSHDVSCLNSRDADRAGYLLNTKDLLKHNPCFTKKMEIL